ncbi:MAG: glycosyltransferase family 2 protein [Nonlabens sp.]
MYRTTLIILITVLLLSGVLIAVFPTAAMVVLAMNFLMALFLAYQKLVLATAKQNDSRGPIADVTQPPFISIHIAACSEPVNSVIETIKAASRQRYQNFEVIVLYNNTANEKLWRPVEAFCESLYNVKFYNYSQVEGYKAGALNICRELMHRDTQFILTLDADYILQKNALATAVLNLEQQEVDLLQFPQAYNNHMASNGLAAELQHYFKSYSASAGKINMNLPTGTLSLVNIKCLEAIGGWPTESITEDAFLGIELIKNNCRIGYCDREIGKGIMPSSALDLKTQRMRWIFGNFQTLIHTITSPQLDVASKQILAAQLTSWINLNGLPWLYIILVGTLSQFANVANAQILLTLSITTIALHSVIQIFIFYKGLGSFSRALNSYSIHIANSVEGSFTWWGYLWSSDRPFARTDKFGKNVGLDVEQFVFNAVLMLAAVLIYTTFSPVLGVATLLLAATRIFARIHLFLNLKDARNQLIKFNTL